MYKEGINLNTVSIEELKILPGIGDNLSRSIILHRELKSEFVNPEEFKSIVPEKVYSGIAQDHNIYTVSPHVWKTRITNIPLQLYGSDLKIYFYKNEAAVVCYKKQIYLIGFSNDVNFRNKIEEILGKAGFFHTVRKIFGWRVPVKALILTGIPDIGELDVFLSRFEVGKIFCKGMDEILSSGSSYGNVSGKISDGKVKNFLPPSKISEDFFVIFPVYPEKLNNPLAFALVVQFGSVAALFMYNMSVGDQKALLQSRNSFRIKNVRIIVPYAVDPIPVLKDFCGNPVLIQNPPVKSVTSDGNLIYVGK